MSNSAYDFQSVCSINCEVYSEVACIVLSALYNPVYEMYVMMFTSWSNFENLVVFTVQWSWDQEQ